MTVTLPPELDPMINAKMKSGGYSTLVELLTEALQQHQTEEEKIAWLKAEVQKGFDSVNHEGPEFSMDDLLEEIEREIAKEHGQHMDHIIVRSS